LALGAVVAHLSCLLFDFDHKSYGDGPILAMIERMRCEPISAAWMQEPPYTLSCYGPAFYYVAKTVADLGGWRSSLVPGRLVALAATLAAAALAAVAAGRKTRSVEIGLLAALLFLVSMPVSEWVPHGRVDMLAMACAAAAYLSVGATTRSLVLSAVFVTAGSLAKPTLAFSAAGIGAHLLATRRYRDLVIFALTVAASGALAWGAVEYASQGFFLTAVLKGNWNPMTFWHGYFFLYMFLCCPLGAVALAATGQLLVASPGQFVRSLYSLGFVVSLAISGVAVSKQGADVNYFLEPALLGSIAIAVDTVGRLRKSGGRWMALAFVGASVVLGLPYVREVKHQLTSPPQQPAAYAMVKRYLAGEPADVELLSDGRMVDTVLGAGHRPWLNDSYLYMLLVKNGTLDLSKLLERLEDGRIKWLFLRKTAADHKATIDCDGGCWPVEVIQCVPRCYDLLEANEGLWVYRHRRYRTDTAGADHVSRNDP
jgi:hypothetical protein